MNSTNNNKTIICLMGPTASGKTSLALSLAEELPIEIISVDSGAVYRGMDIGTAKPSLNERAQVKHHLIDIRDPKEPYSAANFRQDAIQAIADIHARQKIPLLVGGTMLYFKALQEGLSELPSSNPDIRKKIEREAALVGWNTLHKRLKKIDSKAAARIHTNDSQRIGRALEIFELTGKPLSVWHQTNRPQAFSDNLINFIVEFEDRTLLHQRIQRRFKQMLKAGFIDEVRKLYERGDLRSDLPSIRSVGYRQVWQYLEGQYSETEMHQKAIVATRQLAKRQMTWLRHWKNAVRLDSRQKNLNEEIIKNIV